MSNAFSDREKAFEDKWAHDEELRFRVLARRNHHLGLWAAGEMGLAGPAAETYAQTVIQAELAKDGDEAVIRKIDQDFKVANIARTENLIRRRMDEFLASAKAELMAKG